MFRWGNIGAPAWRVAGLLSLLSTIGFVATAPPAWGSDPKAPASERNGRCSGLIVREGLEPLGPEALLALFGAPAEVFRRRACEDPSHLFRSTTGVDDTDFFQRLHAAGPANFLWYSNVFMPRLAGVLGDAVPATATPYDRTGEWTPALQAASLKRGSQQRMAKYLVDAGRGNVPPPRLEAPWSDYVAEAWLGKHAAELHWAPVFAQVRGIRERDGETGLTNQAWLLQRGRHGALLALYGGMTEGWLYEDRPNRLPGPAITVGGQPHADYWDVSFADDGTLVVEGLGEIKSSIHGYANGGRKQIARFLEALTRPNAGPGHLKIYGHPIDVSKLRFRTGDGNVVTTVQLREALALDGYRAERVDATSPGTMPQDARDGFWDDHFVPRFKAYCAEGFYRVVLPSDQAAVVLANRKYLGSSVGLVVAGRASLKEIRGWFFDFVVRAFADKDITARTLDELVFADEDEEMRITFHLDVGAPKPRAVRGRRIVEVPRLGERTPADVDERFKNQDYGAVLEATLFASKELAPLRDPQRADQLELVRRLLPRLGFRFLFRPDGTLRPITFLDDGFRVEASGRAQAFAVHFDSAAKAPEIDVRKEGAILRLAPGDSSRAALDGKPDSFWDSGLVGHDLQRYMPGDWLRREREALGEPAIVLKPGQRAEVEAFSAEATALKASDEPMRRFVFAPPAYGKTIILAQSAARLAGIARTAPKRGLILAVTGQEVVIDQIAQELREQLPSGGKLRFYDRTAKSARADAASLTQYTDEDDVVVPITWAELAALTKKAGQAGNERLREALRALLIDEPQELESRPDAMAALKALTDGQKGIVVAGYSASALREAIVRPEGPFGGRVFPVYPGVTSVLEAQKIAMDEGAITPLRQNDEGHVITYFHPDAVLKALPDAILVETYRNLRGSVPDDGEIARVRAEGASALAGAKDYDRLSVEGRTIGWLAAARLFHAQGLLTSERGFFRLRLKKQANDFFQVLEAYRGPNHLDRSFALYLDGSANKERVIAGIRSEDAKDRVDWVVTCYGMDVGIDATPLSAAVIFTQEVDPELFAQVGGRPMRLHAGKRRAHLWHVSRTPVTEEGLLASLGKKAEELERVRVNGTGLGTVALPASVQGPVEPTVTVPAASPLDAAALVIPQGLFDDVEAARYRRLAAMHQQVVYSGWRPTSDVSEVAALARLVKLFVLILSAPPEREQDARSFVAREAAAIERALGKRGDLFTSLLSELTPQHLGLSMLQGVAAHFLLADGSFFSELLGASIDEPEWPERWVVRTREILAFADVPAATAGKARENAKEPLSAVLAKLDAARVEDAPAASLDPSRRLQGFLALRIADVAALETPGAPLTDVMLSRAERTERALRDDASLWSGFDSLRAALPANAAASFVRFGLMYLATAAGNSHATIVITPVDNATARVLLKPTIDRGTVATLTAELERVHENTNALVAPHAVETAGGRFTTWLSKASSQLGSDFVNYAFLSRAWLRPNPLVPPWERAARDLKELAGKQPAAARFDIGLRSPFFHTYDPELRETFPVSDAASYAIPADLANEPLNAAFRAEVQNWLVGGEDLVAVAASRQGPNLAFPSSALFQAVQDSHSRFGRALALLRKMTPSQQKSVIGDETDLDTFVAECRRQAGEIGAEILDYAHPLANDTHRVIVERKRRLAERLLGQNFLKTREERARLLEQVATPTLELLQRLLAEDRKAHGEAESRNPKNPEKRRLGVAYAVIHSAGTSWEAMLVPEYDALQVRAKTESSVFEEFVKYVDGELTRRREYALALTTSWRRVEWPRGLPKVNGEDDRLWDYAEALGRAAVGPDATEDRRATLIAFVLVDALARFDALDGNTSSLRRKRKDWFSWALKSAATLPDPANQMNFAAKAQALETTAAAYDAEASLVRDAEEIVLRVGVERYRWAHHAREAAARGETPPPIPGVGPVFLKSDLPKFPLSGDRFARGTEALKAAGLLLRDATPSQVVALLSRASETCTILALKARQEIRRRRLGTATDDTAWKTLAKAMAESIRVLRLGLDAPRLVILEESFGRLDLADMALRWISAVGNEVRAGTHALRGAPIVEVTLEHHDGAYTGALVERLRTLRGQLVASMRRFVRERGGVAPDELKMQRWEEAVTLTLSSTRLGELGTLQTKVADLDAALETARKIPMGDLVDLPTNRESTDVPALRRVVADGVEGGTLAPVPPLATLEQRAGSAATADFGVSYAAWALEPARVRFYRASVEPLNLAAYRQVARDVYERELEAVNRFVAAAPAESPLYGPSGREGFVRALRAHLLTFRDFAEKVLAGASNAAPAFPSRPAFEDPWKKDPPASRLRLLPEADLRELENELVAYEKEVSEIGTAANLGFSPALQRGAGDRIFARTVLGEFFRPYGVGRPLEALELVRAALALPAGAVREPAAPSFPDGLEKLLAGDAPPAPALRFLKATFAIADGPKAAEQRAKWAALVFAALHWRLKTSTAASRTATEVEGWKAILAVAAARLPAGHPWKESPEVLLSGTVTMTKCVATDPYLFHNAEAVVEAFPTVATLDEISRFATTPTEGGKVQAFPIGEAAAELALERLARLDAPWTPPAALAGKPLDGYLAALEEGRARLFAVIATQQAQVVQQSDPKGRERKLPEGFKKAEEVALRQLLEIWAALLPDDSALQALRDAMRADSRERAPMLAYTGLCHRLDNQYKALELDRSGGDLKIGSVSFRRGLLEMPLATLDELDGVLDRKDQEFQGNQLFHWLEVAEGWTPLPLRVFDAVDAARRILDAAKEICDAVRKDGVRIEDLTTAGVHLRRIPAVPVVGRYSVATEAHVIEKRLVELQTRIEAPRRANPPPLDEAGFAAAYDRWLGHSLALAMLDAKHLRRHLEANARYDLQQIAAAEDWLLLTDVLERLPERHPLYGARTRTAFKDLHRDLLRELRRLADRNADAVALSTATVLKAQVQDKVLASENRFVDFSEGLGRISDEQLRVLEKLVERARDDHASTSRTFADLLGGIAADPELGRSSMLVEVFLSGESGVLSVQRNTVAEAQARFTRTYGDAEIEPEMLRRIQAEKRRRADARR